MLMKLLNPQTKFMRWLIAFVLVGIFVLSGLGYFESAIQVLNSPKLTFKLGKFDLSLYEVVKGIVVLISLFWLASFVTEIGKTNLRKLDKIKPSNRSLLINGFQTLVYTLVFMVGLDVLGIDLTSLAVLGGAIGIGIGFGLQKITSNFISGIILLFEKSVEEGDLIELSDGTAGFIRNTGARFTLLETFDSKDVMIPNEDFITNRVVNWTFSNSQGRIKITIGVSYESDIELARTVMLEAAQRHRLCSKDPAPQCYLTEFGDSSVNFILYFWMDDIALGRLEMQSDVLRDIWKKFKEHEITIPYPQRDLHIKNPEAIT